MFLLHRQLGLHLRDRLTLPGKDPVKSGSTPVGGPDKSGRKRTKDKGRGLDKELVQPELVTAWIQ